MSDDQPVVKRKYRNLSKPPKQANAYLARAPRTSPDKPLSDRERAFVSAYMGPAHGVAAHAIKLAGCYRYTTEKAARVQAAHLIKRPNIIKAMDAWRAKLDAATVADLRERRQILTQIERDPEVAHGDRIRAIDVHNKMDAAYVERHEHEHRMPEGVSFTFVASVIPGSDNRT